MEQAHTHTTVLLRQAIEALQVRADGIYIDATFGRGGHSRRILGQLGEGGRLIAFDKDRAAVDAAQAQFAGDSRFSMVHESFANLLEVVDSLGLRGRVDGLLLDLGVSSPQLDDAGRGFSFQNDGPLDMRMDRSRGQSAAEWLADAEEDDMARVFKEYGEERFARRIARAIVAARAEAPLRSTNELARLVERASPAKERHKHPATRTFQAVRIFINRELDDLSDCLRDALQVLSPGARLVVISFHSLEDRIVKQFMREQSRGPQLPKRLPVQHVQTQGALRLIGKAIKPGEAERRDNPRARSAVMRVAEVAS